MRRGVLLRLAALLIGALLLWAPAVQACEAERLAAGAEREALVASLGERMLDDALGLRFGEARGKVAGFGDWAYGWIESYAISYRLLAEAAQTLRDAWRDGQPLPPGTVLGERLMRPIQESFRQRVTDPAFGGDVLAADMEHLIAALAAEWPDATGLPDLLRAGLPTDPSEELARVADAQTILLRSTRPMATRLGSFALRLTEAGSLVGGTAALGWASAGAAGGVLGSAAGLGLFWGFDWVVNRTDAQLHRGGFEAQALGALEAAQQRLLAQGRAAIARAVSTEGAAWRARGCP